MGDRLNIYWDILGEYILTGNIPAILLRYLPSTDFSSLYKVVKYLRHDTKLSVQELVDQTKFLKERFKILVLIWLCLGWQQEKVVYTS